MSYLGRVWTDDPAPPGEADYLEFTDVGEDWVRLKWKGTTEMGDGDFKGYIIEKCKEGTDLWIPCNLGPEMAADCKYKIDGLVNGQTYFFRVVAVSTVGQVSSSFIAGIFVYFRREKISILRNMVKT